MSAYSESESEVRMGNARDRMSKRYQALKLQHSCVQCCERLSVHETHARCESCRKEIADAKAARRGPDKAERQLNFNAELARVVETRQTHTARQQAELLGVDLTRVYYLRNRARMRGWDVPLEHVKRTGPGGHESVKWKDVEATMEAGCERCGLRGPHVCVKGDASDRRSWL